MTKIFISVVFILGVTISVFSQETVVRGKVIDKETREPLAYAHLIFKNIDLGTTTDFFGNYHFTIPGNLLNEVIQISYVGYKKKMVKFKDLQNGVVALTPDLEFLSEVNISNILNDKRKVIRPDWGKKIIGLGNLNGGLYPSILARYYERPEKFDQSCFLEEIKFYFFETVDQYDLNPKFRLHIYDVESDGSPGRDLLSNYIIEKPSGRSSLKVNLLSERVLIKNDGFFIGVEHLFIPENKYTEVTDFYMNDSLVAKEYPVLKYGPVYRGTVKKRDDKVVMYYYRPSGWTRIENWDLSNDLFNHQIPSLVFKITLTN